MKKIEFLKTLSKIFSFAGIGTLAFIYLAEAGNPNVRIIHHQGLEIRLDLSTQVLGLDISEDKEMGRFPRKVEAELHPTIKGLLKPTDFVSASVLVAKAKQFDDGLYAAVEQLCQEGTERFMGKRKLLQKVAGALRGLTKEQKKPESLNQSLAFIVAAADLGGLEMAESEEIQLQAEAIKAKFLSDPLKSKPVSFYTWTEDLTKIFQQDRLLQKHLDPDEIDNLARGLSKDGNVLKAYQGYLSFVQKLTNPYPPEYGDLSQIKIIEKMYSFFPPSRSPETGLIKKLYAGRPIPDRFDLADELVKRIQNREIDLAPQKDSGWHDHQIYALEPFVNPELMPESERLHFGEKYKKELINLFRATVALTRETHTKQLEMPDVAISMRGQEIAMINIFPLLSAEPTTAYYLRRARSYSFARELLESTFFESTLNNSYRLNPSGRLPKPLLEELREVESLFYGAYLIVGGRDRNRYKHPTCGEKPKSKGS
jgi:hypothetical protein